MCRHVARILASITGLLALTLPTTLLAQTPGEPVVYFACYIPLIGAVYRIKAPGLPAECLRSTHVEFNWNQVGPAGPQGEKGEQGEPGIPGTFGLAGQGCGFGQVVVGFTTDGALECAAAATGAPPRPSSGEFNGLWSVTVPGGLSSKDFVPFSLQCHDQDPSTGGDVILNLDRWSTRVVEIHSDRFLTITMHGQAERFGHPLGVFSTTFDARFPSLNNKIRFNDRISGSASTVNSSGNSVPVFTASGDLEIMDIPMSGNSFGGHIGLALDIVLDGATLSCTGGRTGVRIPFELKGTRLSGFLRER